MIFPFFPTVQLQVHNENPARYGRNTNALVNLNTKLTKLMRLKTSKIIIIIGRRDFFCSCLICFFPYSRLSSYLLRLFLYLISFLLFPARVFGKTLVHEFPISYSHTEWYLLFSRGEIVLALGRSFAYQNLIILLL